jgi:hypothetical protein
MAIQNLYPATRPTLALDFANAKTLDPRITFTRASEGRFWDGRTFAKAEENLLLQSQDLMTTWTLGSITRTADTTAAPDGTTTADTITETTGSSWHAIAQTGAGSVAAGVYTLSCFVRLGAGREFCTIGLSDSAVSGNYSSATFNLSLGTNTQVLAGGTASGASATITASTNSFYRVTLTVTFSAAFTPVTRIGFTETGTPSSSNRGYGATYAGSTSNSLIVWGAQLEQRSSVSAYTPTTTAPITNYIPVLQTAAANVARFDHDPITGESLGLLIEEQRTNLLLRSAEFNDAAWTKTNATITANTIVSPDGTVDADSISETTATGNHRARTASISVSASTSYTCTVFAKLGFGSVRYLGIGLSSTTDLTTGARRSYVFDLSDGTATTTGGATWTVVSGSATAVGNGWYRCQITVTTDAAASTMFVSIGLSDTFSAATFASGYTGDGFSGIYIWGAQLEAGAFPTSHIPTQASQVTRQADAASMTGANFSSWYRQDAFTVVSEFRRNTTANTAAGGGNSVPRVYAFGTSAAGAFQLRLFSASSAEVFGPSLYMASVWAAGQYERHATAYAVNDAAISRNGLAVVSDSTVDAFAPDMLSIGQNTSGVGNIGQGWIRSIRYYPSRLANSVLQALTA